jgi:hypothetical protein
MAGYTIRIRKFASLKKMLQLLRMDDEIKPVKACEIRSFFTALFAFVVGAVHFAWIEGRMYGDRTANAARD